MEKASDFGTKLVFYEVLGAQHLYLLMYSELIIILCNREHCRAQSDSMIPLTIKSSTFLGISKIATWRCRDAVKLAIPVSSNEILGILFDSRASYIRGYVS